jgi:hypothetical protein
MSVDRLFWIACAFGGVLLLVGCLVPTIEIGQSAYVGAGDAQESFHYERTIRFAGYAQPGALLFLVGGVVLVLLSAAAFLRRSRAVLILAAAALSLAFVVETVRIGDELEWSDGTGVSACDVPLEQCVPFIARATRDLQEEIRRKPEARRPEFELLEKNGYRARGKAGWPLVLWASIMLALATTFRAFLLVLRPLWAGVAVGVCTLLTLAYLLLQALEGLE